MPFDDEEKQADEETLPETPLHAYRERREEDVEGEVDKLESSEPESSQRTEVSEGEESTSFPEHEKD
jgi:hypothetical protein